MARNVHSKTTLAKMAACDQFGLHYWADHPLPGRVWAVDDNQQAHVVRLYAKKGTAALQQVVTRTRVVREWRYASYVSKTEEYVETYDVDTPVPFEVSESTQDLFKAA